jgi:hypothetical protein
MSNDHERQAERDRIERESRAAIQRRVDEGWKYVRDFIADEKDKEKFEARRRRQEEEDRRRRNRRKHKKKESLVTFIIKEVFF